MNNYCCQEWKDFLSCFKNFPHVYDSFLIGEGEISGYIIVTNKYISFDDGWNSYQELKFNFCSFCGSLIKDKKEIE